MKQLKMKHKISAVVTAAVLAAQSGQALAAPVNLTNVTENITTSTSILPNLVSTVSFIAAAGLGVAGVFKLKQHVDNPAQVTLKDGLARLGAAGGCAAIPFVTAAMYGTISDDATAKINVPVFDKANSGLPTP